MFFNFQYLIKIRVLNVSLTFNLLYFLANDMINSSGAKEIRNLK